MHRREGKGKNSRTLAQVIEANLDHYSFYRNCTVRRSRMTSLERSETSIGTTSKSIVYYEGDSYELKKMRISGLFWSQPNELEQWPGPMAVAPISAVTDGQTQDMYAILIDYQWESIFSPSNLVAPYDLANAVCIKRSFQIVSNSPSLFKRGLRIKSKQKKGVSYESTNQTKNSLKQV